MLRAKGRCLEKTYSSTGRKKGESKKKRKYRNSISRKYQIRKKKGGGLDVGLEEMGWSGRSKKYLVLGAEKIQTRSFEERGKKGKIDLPKEKVNSPCRKRGSWSLVMQKSTRACEEEIPFLGGKRTALGGGKEDCGGIRSRSKTAAKGRKTVISLLLDSGGKKSFGRERRLGK